jgi:hypothetical protein
MSNKTKNYRLLQAVAVCVLSLVVAPANATTYAGDSSGGEVATSSQRVPNPEPGVQPAPQPFVESNWFSAGNLIERTAEAVSVAIANRATSTPGLLDAPRELISNIGGYGQIVPTITTVIRNNPIAVSGFFVGLFQFGAGS